MWSAWALFLCGLLLSAFFSGSETGFYRANRMRWVLDSLDGDRTSRGLFWLNNHPSFFVATTLVGNNVANYLTSLAVVMLASGLLPTEWRQWGELIAPLALSPFLFMYGELFPKHLFYQAPNLLLRKAGPLYLLFALALLPMSLLLWALGLLLTRLVGATPPRGQLMIARQELQKVLEEGHESGVLTTVQRALTQGLLLYANRPVTEFMTPVYRMVRVQNRMKSPAVLQAARRNRLPCLLMEDASDRSLLGYVRVMDLEDDENYDVSRAIRFLMDIPGTESVLSALMKLHKANQPFARVIAANGRTLGIITRDSLVDALFRGRA